ncbi:MAG: discoidin domain-containing protein [Pseudomonadota bacterium]|nr:discoidin domain-containing protein [Pseudomonadota bacterium]
MMVRRSRASRHDIACRVGLTLALVMALAVSLAYAQPPTSPTRILDHFGDVDAWKAVASDGVTASVRRVLDAKRPAMQLDFDLGGTAGYAIARRALPLDLPENYAITFWLRADAPVNDLQVKLADTSGDNVWWYKRPNFTFPLQWRQITIKKRQIEFAWGPTKDRVLRHVATIEIAVAAGSGGGHGSVYVSDLVLQELPPAPSVWPPPKVRASSSQPGAAPARALDGHIATAWRSVPGAARAQWLTVDFGRPREFGGLVLQWANGEYASRYDVQFSDDGRRWRTVRRVTEGGSGPVALSLTESETRYLRLALRDGPKRAYAIAELTVKDLAFGATPNAFFAALALAAPRGFFPRGFSGEQGAWTLVGVDGGSDTGLLSEDGALEIGKSGFTLEPFVVERGKVVTWTDVEARPFLVDDDLPMPGVQWNTSRWSLRITTFATGTPADVRLIARYDLTNLTNQSLPITLVLAVRPFQVNPPAQFLNTVGGASPIHDLAWDGGALKVNGTRNVYPLSSPQRVGLRPFDAGPLVPWLATRHARSRRDVHDDFGYASGALFYPATLAPHATTTLGVVAPLAGDAAAPVLVQRTPAQWLAREQASAAATWRDKLDRVTIRVPREVQPLADTLHTALAHILVTRDGPILRPGTRSYARSWIRDGTMIAESLLRLGHASIAADYLRWYAPHQFANGKVPCCIDARGADPVPENDSPGEFIFLVGEVYRYTHDRALLAKMWPHVEAAARYMETLRQSERVDVPRGGGRNRASYGLLPASISHEGYSAKPMHSYWDDLWALKGYTSAVMIAGALGHSGAAERLAAARDEFRDDLVVSLRTTAATHHIGYLPGSAELGDFDPASSTIAFAPGAGARDLPPELVKPTFERYWREFVARRDGVTIWKDYTPYELRTVSTFVRLGWRERAQVLLDFFMAGRRPLAWNQWPEVVGRDPRKVLFVGDLPHAWVASDYIRCVLDLFAYERADGAMMLAGGIPAAWVDRAGVAIRGLRTPYGSVAYSLVRTGDRIAELTLTASGRVPPGGFVLSGPWPRILYATVNGKPVAADGDELRIDELNARVVLQFSE